MIQEKFVSHLFVLFILYCSVCQSSLRISVADKDVSLKESFPAYFPKRLWVEGRTLTVLLTEDVDLRVLEELHRHEIPHSLVNLDIPEDLNNSWPQASDTDTYLLPQLTFPSSFQDFFVSLDCWNRRSKFILMITETTAVADEEPIRQFLEDFWNHDVWNALVVYKTVSTEQNGDETQEWRMISYDRFNNTCPFHRDTVENSPIPFLDKAKYLEGWTLRASVFNFPPHLFIIEIDNRTEYWGFDVSLARTIAEKLRADIEFASPSDGHTFGIELPNGTITGSCGDVVYGRADIAANTRYMKEAWAHIIEPLYPHSQDDICFVVPASGREPVHLIVIKAFAPTTWLLFWLSLPLASIFWYGLIRVSPKKEEHRHTFIDVFMSMYASLLMIGLEKYPTRHYERVFFLFWLYFAMVMIAAYQSSLGSIMTVPHYLPNIDTLRELDASGYRFFVYPGMDVYVKADPDDRVMTRLIAKKEYSDPDLTVMLGRVLQNGRMSAVMDVLSADHLLSRAALGGGRGRPLLHRARESVALAYVALDAARRSPLPPRLSAVVLRVLQAGLPVAWRRGTGLGPRPGASSETEAAAATAPEEDAAPLEAVGPQPLTASHVWGALLVLGAGLGAAAVVLGAEIAFARLHN